MSENNHKKASLYGKEPNFEKLFREKLSDPFSTKYEIRDYQRLLDNEIKNRKVQDEQKEQNPEHFDYTR
jgi:hypothetical protein